MFDLTAFESTVFVFTVFEAMYFEFKIFVACAIYENSIPFQLSCDHLS